MGKGALLSLLELLPQFEALLWLIMLAVFLAGMLVQRGCLRLSGRWLRRLPWAAATGTLILGSALWRLAPGGGVGEGRRAAAVMVCFFALPALLGCVATGLLAAVRRGPSRAG